MVQPNGLGSAISLQLDGTLDLTTKTVHNSHVIRFGRQPRVW